MWPPRPREGVERTAQAAARSSPYLLSTGQLSTSANATTPRQGGASSEYRTCQLLGVAYFSHHFLAVSIPPTPKATANAIPRAATTILTMSSAN